MVATQVSTEDNSPIDKYEEGCEYDREDDRKDIMLFNEKNTEEEVSSRHKGESSSSDSSERSDNSNTDDDINGAKENNCYGDGNGGGDRDTGARGGSAEWLGSLGPSALTEAFGDKAKAKASSSTKSRKPKVGENKNKIVQKGKDTKKLV